MLIAQNTDESPFTPGVRHRYSLEKTGCLDMMFALRVFFTQAHDGIRRMNYVDVDSKLS